MLYHIHNLTGCLVVLPSEASMRVFLRDRQRSVESKTAQKQGGVGCINADAADGIDENCTVNMEKLPMNEQKKS